MLIRRLGAFLLEPAEPAADERRTSPQAAAARPGVMRAVVLGAPAHVPPVAAACAGELRAGAGAPSALVCLWRPAAALRRPEAPARGAGPGDAGDPEETRAPAGATTPAARRLAAALTAEGIPATACGRLAWVALPETAGKAAALARRAGASARVPVVTALAGPRPQELEPVLAGAELALAVLPPGADAALRTLALAALPGPRRHVVPPLAPGPPRWAALAGLARLRSLPEEPR